MNAKTHYYYEIPEERNPQIILSDICIYGATSAGICAAVQAATMGNKVTILAFNRHIGGMTTSGLGATDVGNKHVIGGLAKKFYEEIGAWYGTDNEQWFFEPHVALKIFSNWLQNKSISLYTECRLKGVEKAANRIISIQVEKGTIFKASVFIDASYEGDLMAKAGVSYTIGREGNEVYNELYNGIQYTTHHNFKMFVDPYRKAGDPSSGLLPFIDDNPIGAQGQADDRIQAYNFRLCLCSNPKNKLEFSKPENYDPQNYEILYRYISSGIFDLFGLTRALPDQKADHNNWGAFNSDFIGGNYDWPEGDYKTRERIFQNHYNFQMGIFYFCANDPRLPSIVREKTRHWGLATDEFADSGNWPQQLYIREARRMISDYVLTENDAIGRGSVEDSIGMGSYRMDSHNCKRVVHASRTINEGDIELSPLSPFPIPYRTIIPKRTQCSNLLVPVCISASHVAYGAVRMEPVFMILGQSAGIAASLALKKNGVVQDISYSDLEHNLHQENQFTFERAEIKKYRISSESGSSAISSEAKV
ncbi:MAG TPA: FAD-dependent oxidoreductase [Chitinispirillaceae bacterium]|nr:FAD-dependent oxidoreductase [Chitinispirillaceae bacterium]